MKRTPLKRRTPLVPGRRLRRATAAPRAREARIATARAAIRDIEGRHDPLYLEWVRRQPCCAPGCQHRGPCEAHHHHLLGSGVAKKSPDRYAMPLCLKDHVPGIHALAGRFKGWQRDELKAWQDEQVELHRARYEEQLRLGMVER